MCHQCFCKKMIDVGKTTFKIQQLIASMHFYYDDTTSALFKNSEMFHWMLAPPMVLQPSRLTDDDVALLRAMELEGQLEWA